MTSVLFPDAQIDAIAAMAKTALPVAINGRLEKAVRLLRSGSVELHEDGSAVVISESDGITGYLVQHGRCNCPDSQFQPPEVEGWCCHKIARALVLRLQRHTATPPNGTLEPHIEDEKAAKGKNGCVEPSQNSDATLPVVEASESISASPLPETPASATVRLAIAGYTDGLFTMRDLDEHRLLARLETLLQRFPLEPKTQACTPPTPSQTPVCQWHGAMKESTKAPGTYYCPSKMGDGSYCTERWPARDGGRR